MAPPQPIFTRETFVFFRELACNNRKAWMDTNRERYQEFVVKPFRRLLEELSPTILEIDSRFDTGGRGNFSRINRDIRFAKDKTPYRAHMYLKVSAPFSGEGDTGELYTGISAEAVTVGFRIYSGPKRKESAIGQIAEPRVLAEPKWSAQQKKRLSRRYESYWYALEKKEWTQRDGWPTTAEDWKQLQGWIVRKKLKQADATRANFLKEVAKIFRELYPLLRFTSLAD
jgi:uncharacterized protein (TIGR02453 family)